MSPRYQEALGEVDYILSQIGREEVEKIPQKFRDFIQKNKAKRYEVKDAENLREETFAILAIIYRKFLASPEEREMLEREYQEKLQEEGDNENYTQSAKIDYSPKVISQNTADNTGSALIKAEENKWYRKLFHKIKNVFQINFTNHG
ncbi:MAG: hypothetical protein J6M02_06185 [Clostridia bacterium]|nr:hypothetical protein [Clostridia bacterium]